MDEAPKLFSNTFILQYLTMNLLKRDITLKKAFQDLKDWLLFITAAYVFNVITGDTIIAKIFLVLFALSLIFCLYNLVRATILYFRKEKARDYQTHSAD
jgi:uncharacterized membrane protein